MCFLSHGSCQFGNILLSRVTAPCRLEAQKEHSERHGDLPNLGMPVPGYQMRLNSSECGEADPVCPCALIMIP